MFFKEQKKKKENASKNAKSQGKLGCANRHSKNADRHSPSADWHPVPPREFWVISCFWARFGPFGSIFHSKMELCNKIPQKLTLIVKLGHMAMPCPFFKKSSSSSVVSK